MLVNGMERTEAEIAEAFAVRDEVNRARAERENAVLRASRAEQELRDFKEQVREVAIRVAGEQSWCDSGLNEVLRELGLDPKVGRWTARVVVTFDLTIENGDEPEEYDLMRAVENNLDLSLYRSSDFDEVTVDSTDVEVETIEALDE